MSQQVELNGSCQEVTESFPRPPPEYSSESGVLEVGEGPPPTPWLRTILSSIQCKVEQGGKSLRDDIFVALLFVLVHEVGFTVRGLEHSSRGSSFDVRVLRSLTDLERVDRVEYSYQIPLCLRDCDSRCNLVAVPVPQSSVFIVNFHIPDVETFSVSFDVDKFLAINRDGLPEFANLDQLSKSFKDVCHRFRNAVLDHEELPSLHITKLPHEILLKVSSYLDHKSFVYFSTSCKYLKEALYQDEFVWKRLYKTQFKIDPVTTASCTWKKHFIDEMKNKLRSRRLHRRDIMPYFFPNQIPPLCYSRLPRL